MFILFQCVSSSVFLSFYLYSFPFFFFFFNFYMPYSLFFFSIFDLKTFFVSFFSFTYLGTFRSWLVWAESTDEKVRQPGRVKRRRGALPVDINLGLNGKSTFISRSSAITVITISWWPRGALLSGIATDFQQTHTGHKGR